MDLISDAESLPNGSLSGLENDSEYFDVLSGCFGREDDLFPEYCLMRDDPKWKSFLHVDKVER